MSPKPTTKKPVTAPPLNASWRAGLIPPRAASAVRRLERTEMFMPDVPGGTAQHRTDQEEDTGLPSEREGEEQEDDRPDPGDDRVLPVEVGLGALLDRLGDLLHPVIALRLAQDPEDQIDGIEESQQLPPLQWAAGRRDQGSACAQSSWDSE